MMICHNRTTSWTKLLLVMVLGPTRSKLSMRTLVIPALTNFLERKVWRLILSTAVKAVIFATVLCHSATWGQEGSSKIYRPTNETARITEFAKAEEAIQRIIAERQRHRVWIGTPDLPVFAGHPTGVTFGIDFLELQLDFLGGSPIALRFEDFDNLEVVTTTRLGLLFFGAKVRPDLVLWIQMSSAPYETARNIAILLSDALYALYRVKIAEPLEAAKFAEVVAKYHGDSPKPDLTEDVRRYKVQAEFMIKQKQFAEAARLYGDALKLVPWWSEGRYNRALIFAELKLFREAVQEMKRFMQLEPNSRDARAVQDQIYQWEAAAKLGRN